MEIVPSSELTRTVKAIITVVPTTSSSPDDVQALAADLTASDSSLLSAIADAGFNIEDVDFHVETAGTTASMESLTEPATTSGIATTVTHETTTLQDSELTTTSEETTTSFDDSIDIEGDNSSARDGTLLLILIGVLCCCCLNAGLIAAICFAVLKFGGNKRESAAVRVSTGTTKVTPV